MVAAMLARGEGPRDAAVSTRLCHITPDVAQTNHVVEAKLRLRWSPDQIAHWLRRAYPGDPLMRVSHEAIYLSLFAQARGALKRELTKSLRTGRAMRFPRGARTRAGQGRGQLVGAVSIRERPAEVEDRAVPGH